MYRRRILPFNNHIQYSFVLFRFSVSILSIYSVNMMKLSKQLMLYALYGLSGTHFHIHIRMPIYTYSVYD